MSPLLSGAITLTLWLYGLAILLMLWRMLRGPSAQDRVLAIDAIYVIGMLVALVVGRSIKFAARSPLRGAPRASLIRSPRRAKETSPSPPC